MEPSESLEYYKLKDELAQLLKDEIGKRLDNERDLQQRYIGLGLKVATAGIAAAVLTLGVFGIKSVYEVNSAVNKIPEFITKRVDTEVTKRFDSVNPVAQYESMLLDSAARSIASSLETQAEQGYLITLDERRSDVIVRGLSDKTIRPATKMSLIGALSTAKIRNVSPAIDQAVIALTEQIGNDSSGNEQNLLRCLAFFSFRSPERFAGEIEKLYDKHGGKSGMRLAIGRYTVKLPKDYGDALAKKLEKADDPNIKYMLHIRDLTIGRAKQVNTELLAATLIGAFNNSEPSDGITLSELIDDISSLDGSPEIVAQLIESIRAYADANKLTLAVSDDSPNSVTFGFYGPDGKGASADMDRDKFEILIGLAADRIKDNLRQSKGEFTDPIKQAMDFWFPRSDSDVDANPPKAGAFSLGDAKKVNFITSDGREIPGSTLSSRAIVTTQGTGSDLRVILKWNNEIGDSKSLPLKKIVDFNARSLKQYGLWNRVSNDD
jgi:hypothetical protein